MGKSDEVSVNRNVDGKVKKQLGKIEIFAVNFEFELRFEILKRKVL